jgi:hypothetical protein
MKIGTETAFRLHHCEVCLKNEPYDYICIKKYYMTFTVMSRNIYDVEVII